MKDRGLCTTFVYKWRLLHKEQNLSKKYLYDTFKNIVKILCLVKNMLYLCSTLRITTSSPSQQLLQQSS